VPAERVAGEDTNVMALIAAARSGSSTSLGKLLANYRGYLLLVANQEVDTKLRVKIAPSDVAQETFLLAHQKFDAFEGTNEHEFRGWLRKILVNRYKDLWREFQATKRRCADREVPLDRDVSGPGGGLLAKRDDTPSRQMIAAEELSALEQALATLPPEQRMIVEMRNWDRLSFVEIGERLGKSQDAIRKAWARAIKQLVDSWGRGA
jgi:RNA polymerase sigma-70 factor (ECF subfamily)